MREIKEGSQSYPTCFFFGPITPRELPVSLTPCEESKSPAKSKTMAQNYQSVDLEQEGSASYQTEEPELALANRRRSVAVKTIGALTCVLGAAAFYGHEVLPHMGLVESGWLRLGT